MPPEFCKWQPGCDLIERVTYKTGYCQKHFYFELYCSEFVNNLCRPSTFSQKDFDEIIARIIADLTPHIKRHTCEFKTVSFQPYPTCDCGAIRLTEEHARKLADLLNQSTPANLQGEPID